MLNGNTIQDVAVEKPIKALAEQIANLTGISQDLLYKVPTPPTGAGTYTLKATVAADASITYSWVK